MLVATDGGLVVGAVTMVCTEATDDGLLLYLDKTGDVSLYRCSCCACGNGVLLLFWIARRYACSSALLESNREKKKRLVNVALCLT